MYYLNKIVGAVVSPIGIGLVMLGGVLAVGLYRKLTARVTPTPNSYFLIPNSYFLLPLLWLWLWATPLMNRVVGASLERPYLVDGCVPSAACLPKADAIVLHGGSMGSSDELRIAKVDGEGHSYAEMWTSADRVWMAARLWKAGKAPIVYVTGGGVRQSTAGLLADFGVPTNAIVFAEAPRNTEEEARFIAARYTETRPRVLVVTSAWHMKRTMLMYAKYAPNVEAIPAPCDFENTMAAMRAFSWGELLPNDEALVANRVALHEWVGIVGYRWRGEMKNVECRMKNEVERVERVEEVEKVEGGCRMKNEEIGKRK